MSAPQASESIAEQLAAFCAQLQLTNLPADVVQRARELCLDYLGVCYRGMQAGSSQAALRAVRALAAPGAATVVGQAEGMPSAWAALVNGTAAHALEMDDVTSKSSLHPGVAVFPAVLALSEELGAPSSKLITAAVVGYEVTMRVGNALNAASAYARGFHPTGVAGAFGAAAAASSLLELDRIAMANALGIAGTMASGSLEYVTSGAWTKRLNAGWAAHCGVVAARLAAEGFTGPPSAIEGPLGLFRGYTDDPRPHEATAALGHRFEIMRVSIKPYACCRYNHGLIDCMLQLRQEPAFDLLRVREIRLGVLSGGALLIAEPIERKRSPSNVVDAQFSAPFAAAVALVNGAAGLQQYTQTNVDDREIRRLMSIVSCYRDAQLDAVYPDHWPAAATLTLDDGTTREARAPFPLGEPENPVDQAGLIRKFVDMVSRPFADDAARAIMELPKTPVRELMALLRAP